MLTETQWDQLEIIFGNDGRCVRKLAADAFIVSNADRQQLSKEVYATHEQATLALINGTYTKAAQRVETCVQHGAKNRPQWAKAKPQHANVMSEGSV